MLSILKDDAINYVSNSYITGEVWTNETRGNLENGDVAGERRLEL